MSSMQKRSAYRVFSCILTCLIICSLILTPSASYAQTMLNLPVPGTMVMPTGSFVPVMLKGMTIHPEDPLKFDFIIDSGNADLETRGQGANLSLESESTKLIKYFLASLTVPEKELWVNLSPNEQHRIIPDALGQTKLGQDLLAQDYILKQLTASLMYPEDKLGAQFWERVYRQAHEKYGTTDIPIDTFNKVWIIPQSASVYEHANTVYVTNSKLKVLTDHDYQSFSGQGIADTKNLNANRYTLYSEIIKEIIIPAIEKEVNEGKNFAPLRQIYHSLILAKWYKETLRNSILNKVYADQNKIAGIATGNAGIKDEIYAQYMAAYKKGVYDYMREEYDTARQEIVPRKYFSGGFKADPAMAIKHDDTATARQIKPVGDYSKVAVELEGRGKEIDDDSAMATQSQKNSERIRALREAFMDYSFDKVSQITPAIRSAVDALEKNMGIRRMPGELLSNFLANGEAVVFVARDKDTREIVGYIFGIPHKYVKQFPHNTGLSAREINASYYVMSRQVLDKKRGKGIGRALRFMFREEVRRMENFKYVAAHQDDIFDQEDQENDLVNVYAQGDQLKILKRNLLGDQQYFVIELAKPFDLREKAKADDDNAMIAEVMEFLMQNKMWVLGAGTAGWVAYRVVRKMRDAWPWASTVTGARQIIQDPTYYSFNEVEAALDTLAFRKAVRSEDVPDLQRILSHEDASLRKQAESFLSAQEIMQGYIQALPESFAIEQLAAIGGTRVISRFQDLLRDPDTKLRTRVERYLTTRQKIIGYQKALPQPFAIENIRLLIEKYLPQEQKEEVIREMIKTAGLKKAKGALQALLSNFDANIRLMAESYLTGTEIIEGYRRALPREFAMERLSETADPRAQVALEELLEDSPESIRTLAQKYLARLKKKLDPAMATQVQEAPGGIDMNAIPVTRQGQGADIRFFPDVMDELRLNNVEGFTPVIIQISPLQSVFPLLGLADPDENPAKERPRGLSVSDEPAEKTVI